MGLIRNLNPELYANRIQQTGDPLGKTLKLRLDALPSKLILQ